MALFIVDYYYGCGYGCGYGYGYGYGCGGLDFYTGAGRRGLLS